jgi:hypothetical protein
VIRSLSVTALAVLLAVGGCSSGSRSPAPVASAVGDHAPFPSPSMAAIDEPPGTNTCKLLVAAINGATLMEPGVVDAIVAASATADAPLADAATRLGAAYAAATMASTGPDEPDKVAAVSQAGSDMATVCDESDLATVG